MRGEKPIPISDMQIDRLKEIYKQYNDPALNRCLNENHPNYYKGVIECIEAKKTIPVWYNVQHDNVLLHSPTNKEIMLKAIFKPLGKKAGVERYELDDFEFHPNYTKRTLAPVNPNFIRFKQSEGMLAEIKKTVEYHLNKILKKRVHFEDIDQILYPKIDIPQTEKTTEKVVKKSEPKPTFIRKEPKQLELKFEE